MTVRELTEKLGLEVLTGEANLGAVVKGGYASDLLSDVIGNAAEGSVWVTVQRHVNILGVARLKEIVAIVIPRTLPIDAEVIERAQTEGIVLLRTALTAFEITGRLYEALNKGER